MIAPDWHGKAAIVLFALSAACGGAVSARERPPSIAWFTASRDVIRAGESAELSWLVVDAATVSLRPGAAAAARGDLTVTPAETTTYSLVATQGALTAAAAVTVTVLPADPDAIVTVDSGSGRSAISPFVYGYNALQVYDAPLGATWLRLGGNRWTTYNWETNYSNAGADTGPYQSDASLGMPSLGAARAALPGVDSARVTGAGLLVTVPIQGWVARDAAGDVSLATPVADRFLPSRARKGGPLADVPDVTDGAVYQDEFAHLLAKWWGQTPAPLHLALDNEPDLWGWVDGAGGHGTHPEVQRSRIGYADLLARSIEFASAIKDAAPRARVTGPVLSGWSGYVDLGGAPDAAAHGDFLDFYLDGMRAAATAQGRRLLDLLDLHYYSEATGCGVRVNAAGAGNGDCVVAARVQAARSLADGAFVETSWITQRAIPGQPIDLVHRMQAKLDAHLPGTRLALSEYDFGGGDHASGAVVQADALGQLGKLGVEAAAYWPPARDHTWTDAAWAAYRDYDGAGASFGDTAVACETSDLDHISAYASVEAARPERLVAVLVHRPTLDARGVLDLRPRTVSIVFRHATPLGRGRVWQLSPATSTQPLPRPARMPDLVVRGRAVTLALPPLSVTTVELTP